MSRDKNIDRGWAWVILAASFICNVIVDGVCLTFGIFYLEFLDYFKENKSKTAWVGSVLNGMYMIMGPITAAFAQRFGCRVVTIVGAVWSSVAFIICRYSPNVNILILTFGVLGGMGFGLLYLPSIVIVGYYFDKRRALATGIATCGSGIGGFIFAPLEEFLIKRYAWQGAMLIIAGIVLNSVVCGALFRPISTVPTIDVDNDNNEDKEMASESSPMLTSSNTIVDGECRQRKLTNFSDSWHSHASLASSMESINKQIQENEKVTNIPKEKGKSLCKDIAEGIHESMDFKLLKNPVFVIYGFSCILCMLGFFIPFVYLADYAIGIGAAPQRAAFLISVLGITNTVGRVVVGWVSDRTWADCLLINNCALIIGGVATVCCPLCKTYTLLCIYATIFGLCIAAFVSLRSIILVDLIGLDRLTSAFGLIVLCQGISTFVGAPFAGFLYDITGSFNASFYVAGSAIALSGVICLPLRKLARRLTHSRQKGETPTENGELTVEVSQNNERTVTSEKLSNV